jgi:hypothetical protein
LPSRHNGEHTDSSYGSGGLLDSLHLFYHCRRHASLLLLVVEAAIADAVEGGPVPHIQRLGARDSFARHLAHLAVI